MADTPLQVTSYINLLDADRPPRKDFGISVYLAHMGFPVAAKTMAFSVRDGLFSSINVVLENSRPRYPYMLLEGIAADQVGMTIIENEGIIHMITPPPHRSA